MFRVNDATAAVAAISIRKPSRDEPAATEKGIDDASAIIPVHPVRRCCAARFGRQPISCAIFSLRSLVSGSTCRLPLKAWDTVVSSFPGDCCGASAAVGEFDALQERAAFCDR